MNAAATNKTDLLRLTRFNGVELFSVTEARYSIYDDDGTTFVVFRVEAPTPVQLLEDTEELQGSPFWELVWRAPAASQVTIAADSVFEIPSGYDDDYEEHVTNFYYCEHEGSDENCIQILTVSEVSVRARITGITIDVNFYDGSKPPTRLEVETEFARDDTLRRSFS